MTNAGKSSVGKSQEHRQFGTSSSTQKDNIKTDLREISYEVLDWIQPNQGRAQWQKFLNTIMKLRVHKIRKFFEQMSKYQLCKRIVKNVVTYLVTYTT
jgi:hypothetical protein